MLIPAISGRLEHLLLFNRGSLLESLYDPRKGSCIRPKLIPNRFALISLAFECFNLDLSTWIVQLNRPIWMFQPEFSIRSLRVLATYKASLHNKPPVNLCQSIWFTFFTFLSSDEKDSRWAVGIRPIYDSRWRFIFGHFVNKLVRFEELFKFTILRLSKWSESDHLILISSADSAL